MDRVPSKAGCGSNHAFVGNATGQDVHNVSQYDLFGKESAEWLNEVCSTPRAMMDWLLAWRQHDSEMRGVMRAISGIHLCQVIFALV